VKKNALLLTLLILVIGQIFSQFSIAHATEDDMILNPKEEVVSVEENLLHLRILPERGIIKPSEDIWIGIEQSIKKDWHTYWKNPGDSGTAPEIHWTLPKGFEIGDIQWPTPDKIPYNPLLNYGYSDHVILLQKLKAPKKLSKGALTLIAEIEILVCEEECIPVFERIEFTLNGENSKFEDNTAYLAAARAKLPQQTNWSVIFTEEEETLEFTIKLPEDHGLANNTIRTANFIPADWGVLHNAAPLKTDWNMKTRTLTLSQKKGERSAKQLGQISGVLSFKTRDFLLGFDVIATLEGREIVTAAAQTTATTAPQISLLTLLWAACAALFGGMILNLMPCVFPILSIKALGLIKIGAEKPTLAKLHGLSYAAGVILSFLLIAGLLIALQAGGAAIGWGFQLQNPTVIALLAYLFFIIGLNLSGEFEIAGHFGGIGNRLTQSDNLSGAFFTGVLATLVATPCTAPLMGAAIGIALTQPAAISLIIFAMLGAGLALPYVALSFSPALQKHLPKPGKWMKTFRQFLAFPMYASTAWLIWVLSQQINDMSVLLALLGLVLLAFALWLIQHSPQNKIRMLALAAVILALFCIPTTHTAPQTPIVHTSRKNICA